MVNVAKEAAKNSLPIHLRKKSEDNPAQADSNLIEGLKTVFNDKSIETDEKNEHLVAGLKARYRQVPKEPATGGDAPASNQPGAGSDGEAGTGGTFVPPITEPNIPNQPGV